MGRNVFFMWTLVTVVAGLLIGLGVFPFVFEDAQAIATEEILLHTKDANYIFVCDGEPYYVDGRDGILWLVNEPFKGWQFTPSHNCVRVIIKEDE